MIGMPASPLRPLGGAEILDTAVRLVRRNVGSVLVVSVPYAIVAALVSAFVQYRTLTVRGSATLAEIGGVLVAAWLGIILTGLLAPLYTSDLLGEPITINQSLRRLGRRGLLLFLLGVVVAVAEGVGLAALLVGGVWLWGIWAVAAPAFALERTGVFGALGRSRKLVSGTFWRVWGIRALGWFLTFVLGLLVVLPVGALASWVTGINPFDRGDDVTNAAAFSAILAAGQLVSSALLAPVTSAIDVLLYTDLRMRKEGMDILLGLPTQPSATAAAPVSAW